jgi:hypothetical protein
MQSDNFPATQLWSLKRSGWTSPQLILTFFSKAERYQKDLTALCKKAMKRFMVAIGAINPAISEDETCSSKLQSGPSWALNIEL